MPCGAMAAEAHDTWYMHTMDYMSCVAGAWSHGVWKLRGAPCGTGERVAAWRRQQQPGNAAVGQLDDLAQSAMGLFPLAAGLSLQDTLDREVRLLRPRCVSVALSTGLRVRAMALHAARSRSGVIDTTQMDTRGAGMHLTPTSTDTQASGLHAPWAMESPRGNNAGLKCGHMPPTGTGNPAKLMTTNMWGARTCL